MPINDFAFLAFTAEPAGDSAAAFPDYMQQLGNNGLRRYADEAYVHTSGAKLGQSLACHVLDLVAFAARLGPVAGLTDDETRVLFLALTIHDINKTPFGTKANGQPARYVDAAKPANIAQELEMLGVDSFLPDWREYLNDIVFLAHGHQVAATGSTLMLDQHAIAQTRLGNRLRTLRVLVQAADCADNSHSGDFLDHDERHLRHKLLGHVNTLMNAVGGREYRFVGHRLSELRGLLTNLIHNAVATELRERFGPDACIDLQYYPEGINYLLDRMFTPVWDDELVTTIARRVQRRFMALQLDALQQFIKPKPICIVVDDAAMSSGASLDAIFDAITVAVMRKRYPEEKNNDRDDKIRHDLAAALGQSDTVLQEQIAQRSQQVPLSSHDEEVLKRGEFVAAYRKFLEDHRAAALKARKRDPWQHVYRLFELPAANWPVYDTVDPFRRGHFIAADLAPLALETMRERALTDLQSFDDGERSLSPATDDSVDNPPLDAVLPDMAYITDYLRRNLQFWDTLAAPRSMTLPAFTDVLREYSDPRRQFRHCSTCGSPLEANEAVAIQFPPQTGVQQFSNRLPGGTGVEPKRNICDICRMQFILEKLAWRGHRDKHGAEQMTFYLHLFPHTFFPAPLLRAWWLSLQRLNDVDHRAFFIDTRAYFRHLHRASAIVAVRGWQTTTNGVSLPTPGFIETISTTPIIPIVAPGANYGLQFQLALEKAVVLARWFDCRVLLSRLPVPSVNLSHTQVDGAPAVLMVDGAPRNLSWLLPETTLDRAGFTALTAKLTLLHRVTEELETGIGRDFDQKKKDALPHDLAVAAAGDALAVYYTVDRLIEKHRMEPDRARAISKSIVPLLAQLVRLS